MHRRARRRVAILLPIGVMTISSITAGLTCAPAGADGILPPANPASNIAPSTAGWLSSIDAARSEEDVGTMDVSESALAALPLSEQMFAVVDFSASTAACRRSTHDRTAQLYLGGWRRLADDPSIPTSVTADRQSRSAGSAGRSSALEADYYFMYDDGFGGSATTNIACSLATPSGCWLHRDIIRHEFGGCPDGPPVLSMGAASSSSDSIAALLVSSCAPPTDVTMTWSQVEAVVSERTIGIAPLASGSGYWEAEANGTVASFGAAPSLGSLTGRLNAPLVGITATPDGGGYWLVASDGGIFSFGDARFYGSTGSLRLNEPIVGMASTPDGKGYWLVASDGGIFSFGDAVFHGSVGGSPLNQPVVGMADDPATGGYWEVVADGGIFSYSAPFFGSTGSIHLNKPIVGIEPSPNGQGYRFVASDGGIFTYGQAAFDGSTGNIGLASPVVDMAPDNATNGYWMAAADGGIFAFGGAAYMGRLVSSAG